jgi:hypothetical protein
MHATRNRTVKTDRPGVGRVRDKIAAHLDVGIDGASYGGAPVLLQAARPFVQEITATLGLPFYDGDTKQAVQELENLISWAELGRARGRLGDS